MQLSFAGIKFRFYPAMACWVICCLFSFRLHADTLPNAGSLQQSLPNRLDFNPPSQLPISSMPPLQAKANKSGGATVIVSRFKWAGNSMYSDQDLNRLTDAFLNHPIDFSQLETVAVLVANHYRSAGYVVQTKLPTQDIANGEVTIDITEARFGTVRMDGPNAKLIHVNRIQDTIYALQPSGALLNSNNIDRALAVLSDLAGIQVQGRLLPNTESGLTDFIVSTQDAPAVTIEASTDNAGAHSTGQERVSVALALNSPLRMGDQLTAHAMTSRGSDYLRGAYRWPVGFAGWTMGVNASRLNYNSQLTSDSSGVQNSLYLTGWANAFELETTVPLAKRNRYKLDAAWGLNLKQYMNQRDSQVDSMYDTRTLNAGLQGQFADSYAGGGFSTWQMIGTGGILSKKQGNVNEGSYNKLKYAFNRTQEFMSHWSWQFALNGQASKANLDASEKFYLGGMTGVRAYPSSEGGGSVGQLLSLELRHSLSSQSAWFVFYDQGQVVVDPYGTNAFNKIALKGYGLGYSVVSAKGVHVKAMISRRLGRNPNPTATGQDQDGSLVLNRFWLMANVPF